jgi:hypothetical protein
MEKRPESEGTAQSRAFVQGVKAARTNVLVARIAERYRPQYHINMARADRLVSAMRNNPRDWRIERLKTVADRYGIPYRQPGTSHVTFAPKGAPPVTVPAHKPIKPVYVRKFVAMIDAWEQSRGEKED